MGASWKKNRKPKKFSRNRTPYLFGRLACTIRLKTSQSALADNWVKSCQKLHTWAITHCRYKHNKVNFARQAVSIFSIPLTKNYVHETNLNKHRSKKRTTHFLTCGCDPLHARCETLHVTRWSPSYWCPKQSSLSSNQRLPAAKTNRQEKEIIY